VSTPSGTTVTLMVGPVIAVPAPASLTEAIRSVQVTQSETGSGFQITFDVEPGYGAGSSTGPSTVISLLLKPYNRVIVMASLTGFPSVLVDGVITHLELAPAQGGQPSTLTVTGSDISAVMDLWQESLEYPALDPELIVAEIVLGYAIYGIVPVIIPSSLAVPPLPTQRVPIKTGTDLAYIKCLAAQYGYDFYVAPGPVPLTNYAYWGPQVRVGMIHSALSVNLGPQTNVDSLTFSYDATTPTIAYGSVLDQTTNLEVPVLGVPLYDLPPLALYPAVAVNLPYVRATLFKHQGLTVAQAQVLADSIVSKSTQNTLVATGELDAFRYGAVLTARSLVGVRGAGFDYDGIYYVRSVTHTIGPGSWRQGFELVREGLGSTVPLVLP
jgi:hypothetical protein